VDEREVKRLQDRAVKYFCEKPGNFPTGRPYNCCESVLLALKDELGVATEIIPRLATGIGAGVSLNGLLCGSISSVALVVGLKHGRTSPEEDPQPVWKMIDEYLKAFNDRFGAVNCRELTRLDMKKQEDLKEYFAKVHDYACAERIRFAVQKALQLIH